MVGDTRFFQDFFDGQIVKEESQNFKLFKLMLVSLSSALGLFMFLSGICNWVEFAILELGLFWNICIGLGKKYSLVFCILISFLYFFYTAKYGLYATGLVYIACYIPFQLIATTKDYEGGDFVQIKKKMTDFNKVVFYSFFMAVFVFLAILNACVAANFTVIDSLAGALLVSSALLRNERYLEYYIFRILGLVATLILWVMVFLEFGQLGIFAIILMYLSYLVFDIVNYVYQTNTYINQYMIQVEKYNKINDQILINEKLSLYEKMKKDKNKE